MMSFAFPCRRPLAHRRDENLFPAMSTWGRPPPGRPINQSSSLIFGESFVRVFSVASISLLLNKGRAQDWL